MVAQAGNAVADELESDPVMRRGALAPLALGEPVAVRRDSQIRRAPNSSGLYDVLDLILDKGIVIDAFVRVSLVGIELLTVDLRVVIASVDTYLRYAEGVERLQVYDRSESKRLPDMVGSGMKTHALKKGAEKVGEALTGKSDDDNEDDGGHEEHESGGVVGALSRGVRNVVGRLVGEDDEEGEGDGRKQQGRAPEHRRRLPDAGRHPTPGRGGKPGGPRR